MTKVEFDSVDFWTLRNALSVARARYVEDSNMMSQIAAEGGTGMVTIHAARQLENQFDRQIEEVDLLLEKIDAAEDEED